jgi:hypothetical protein
MKRFLGVLLALVLVASFSFMTAVPVAAEPSDVWVDHDFSSSTVGWGESCFATIQEGVDAVASGGTVHVAKGTYLEQITISQTLWLKGEGQHATVLDYPPTLGGTEYLILVNAEDVRITGLQLFGHFEPGNRGYYVVYTKNTGLIVEDCAILGIIGVFGNLADGEIRNNHIAAVRKGIYVSGGDNLLVDGNTLEPAVGAGCSSNCGAIYMDHVTGVTISGNTMKDFSSSGDSSITAGRGIEGSDNSYVTISGNTFENIRDAITMWKVTNVDITQNYIARSDRYGINIKGQDISITENTIVDSGHSGINVAEFDIPTTNVVINHNNIFANEKFGVVINYDGTNVDDITADATNNWWGNPRGPCTPNEERNPAGKCKGKGNAVSLNVEYDPWLRQPVVPAGRGA